MALLLTEAQSQAIRAHGERAYPQECCGFLVGRDTPAGRPVVEAVPAVNERGEEERHNRFTINPYAFLQAEKRARAREQEIVGFYHSHPDVAAVPSAYDRDHAWPWYSYVIVSVREGTAGELRSWQLQDDRSGFLPEDWCVVA